MPVPTLRNDLVARFGNVVLSAHASDVGGEPPEWIMVIPAGAVNGVDGRGPYVNKDPARIISQTKSQVWPKPIDYNHQTVFACLNGGEAPAAAWITDLEVREGAIWAKVDWTDRGAQSVASREYRFVSPTMQHDKDTGEIQAIHSVGLVNVPNIAELPAIASQIGDINPMDKLLQALRQALGLSDDADQDAILSACRDSRGQVTATASALTPLITDLKLSANASVADVVKAAQTALATPGRPDPEKYVPMAAFTELQTQVASLVKHNATSAAETAVASAMQLGKITPALKDWALDYASQNPVGFADWVAKTPAVVKPGGSTLTASGTPAAGTGGDHPEDVVVEVCAALGISVADYKKTREKLNKEGA